MKPGCVMERLQTLISALLKPGECWCCVSSILKFISSSLIRNIRFITTCLHNFAWAIIVWDLTCNEFKSCLIISFIDVNVINSYNFVCSSIIDILKISSLKLWKTAPIICYYPLKDTCNYEVMSTKLVGTFCSVGKLQLSGWFYTNYKCIFRYL